MESVSSLGLQDTVVVVMSVLLFSFVVAEFCKYQRLLIITVKIKEKSSV